MSKIIDDYKDVIANYDPKKNITKNILSKYEKTKILGLRMEQLARSAEPYVDFKPEAFDPYDIAIKELRDRKLPFMLCRTLPNGRKEYWRLEDMIIL
jgi:DNA-directed RNA polymerase I, II, and III subunit RPABC2